VTATARPVAPGFVRGRPGTSCVDTVKERRDGREEQAERLLLELVEATARPDIELDWLN
jgi:hypothetical protein